MEACAHWGEVWRSREVLLMGSLRVAELCEVAVLQAEAVVDEIGIRMCHEMNSYTTPSSTVCSFLCLRTE